MRFFVLRRRRNGRRRIGLHPSEARQPRRGIGILDGRFLCEPGGMYAYGCQTVGSDVSGRSERDLTHKSAKFLSCGFSCGGGVGTAGGSSAGAGVDVLLDGDGAGDAMRGTGDATREGEDVAAPCSAAFWACLFLSYNIQYLPISDRGIDTCRR